MQSGLLDKQAQRHLPTALQVLGCHFTTTHQCKANSAPCRSPVEWASSGTLGNPVIKPHEQRATETMARCFPSSFAGYYLLSTPWFCTHSHTQKHTLARAQPRTHNITSTHKQATAHAHHAIVNAHTGTGTARAQQPLNGHHNAPAEASRSRVYAQAARHC